MLVRSFQASSTYLRKLASAFGPGSVAMTLNPRARYSAAQLAPITPAPTIAMRRIGLLYDILVFLCVDFCVSDSGEISLRDEQRFLFRAVEFGGINGAGQIGDEHPAVFEIESDPDSLHQMREQNVRCRMFGEIGVNRRAAYRVPARWISAVGPIQEPIFQIELEIDRFRQTIEQEFDVGAVRRRLILRDVDLRTEDSALARIIGSFLRPINLSAIWINGDSNAPFCLIGAWPRVAFAGVDQSFDVRTIQVRAHHAHSFAVAPVEFPARLFEMELLWRECLAFANDGYAILTVEIGALDRTVVLVRHAHVGPVNVSGFKIDDDAIRGSSTADNDFSIRPIGVSRMNPAAACFKKI